jgi:predicted RNase H-like HicB family nuclease
MSDDEIVSYQFIVMIRRTRTGYSADVPDLEGCVSAGMTVEQTKQLIAEAITLHLELMQQTGQPIPVPRKSIEFVIDEDAGEEFCSWVEVVVSAKVPLPEGA